LFATAIFMEVAVSVTDGKPYDEDNPLIDRETLTAKIEHILGGEPDSPDALASLFVELRQGLEGGLRGINRTHAALALAVEVAYLHSRALVRAQSVSSLAGGSVDGRRRTAQAARRRRRENRGARGSRGARTTQSGARLNCGGR
jgi:hypothetical protein